MDRHPLQSIRARLAALRRRALALTLAAGLTLALAAGAILVLAWVGLEALIFLSPSWRTGLGLMVLMGSGAILAIFLRLLQLVIILS